MKHKTLIALAVASLFAAPAVYAASSVEKTSNTSVIAMTEDAIPDQQENNADLIKLPKSVIAMTEDAIPDQDRDGDDLIRLPDPVQMTEGDEQKEGESSQLIAEGDEQKEGESSQLIAEGDEQKEGGEKAELIA